MMSGLITGAVRRMQVALAAAPGAGLIGFMANAANAVLRTVRSKLGDSVTVNDFVTGGDGTDANPWTGWDTAIVWAGHTQYDCINGYYAYATSPNFALDHLCLNGKAGTIFRHTGAGVALNVDCGASQASIVRHIRIRLRLEGNAATTKGVYWRGAVHSETDIDFHDVTGVCFHEVGGVMNRHKLRTTALTSGQTHIPVSLLVVDKRGVGGDSNANTYDLTAENCSGYGVVLNDCSTSIFKGTSEGNANGVYISATSNYNNFQSFDMEINTGSGDLDCYGNYNSFNGVLSTKLCIFYGSSNTINGGTYNAITNSGERNKYDGVAYSNNGGAFTDTAASIVKHAVFNVATGIADIDKMPPVESIRTGKGAVVMATATATTLFSALAVGRYEVFAHVFASDAANFAAAATVLSDGTVGGMRIIANNGAALTLTLSAGNVRATQSSGGSATVNYVFLRLN